MCVPMIFVSCSPHENQTISSLYIHSITHQWVCEEGRGSSLELFHVTVPKNLERKPFPSKILLRRKVVFPFNRVIQYNATWERTADGIPGIHWLYLEKSVGRKERSAALKQVLLPRLSSQISQSSASCSILLATCNEALIRAGPVLSQEQLDTTGFR